MFRGCEEIEKQSGESNLQRVKIALEHNAILSSLSIEAVNSWSSGTMFLLVCRGKTLLLSRVREMGLC